MEFDRTPSFQSLKEQTPGQFTSLDAHDAAENFNEREIIDIGRNLQKTGNAQELSALIQRVRPYLKELSKAKAAKLVRTLVDLFLDMEKTTDALAVQLCHECIEWAKDEKRTFLRQALEARLTALHFERGTYQEALKQGSALLRELKKLDDKQLLVEVQLTESKTYHALGNLQKSKASLTSARTTANSMYCPPKMQASLDLQSGILNAAEEKDWKTAYSYFYEAFEGYDSIENKKAITSLKYMLLCKVMLGSPDEVQTLLSGKLALKYQGREIEAMRNVAKASQERSISKLKEVLIDFDKELHADKIIEAHLDKLYDNLLEKNLLRIIEPFSRVQVQHIATLIKLPLAIVEKKLSQMILDKKFDGILSQGEGALILFDESKTDKTYETTLDVIASMSEVVDGLYQKAKQLT